MLSKHERLQMFYHRLLARGPFPDRVTARMELEETLRAIEDEFSGIPESRDAAPGLSDGRMYPPHKDWEVETGTPSLQTFRHRGHRTCFGINGSIRITTPKGQVVLNLPGQDGRTIKDLEAEHAHEPHPES